MNRRQAKVRALKLVTEHTQAMLDSAAAFYFAANDRDAAKITGEIERILAGLENRLARLQPPPLDNTPKK